MDFLVKIQVWRKKGWIFLLKSRFGATKCSFFVKIPVWRKNVWIFFRPFFFRHFSRERRAKGSRLVGLQPGPGRSPRTSSGIWKMPEAFALGRGHMPEGICPGVHARGHMPGVICPGAYALGHMAWGICHRPYALGHMLWGDHFWDHFGIIFPNFRLALTRRWALAQRFVCTQQLLI